MPVILLNRTKDHIISCLPCYTFCHFVVIFAEAYYCNSVVLFYEAISYLQYCLEGMRFFNSFVSFYGEGEIRACFILFNISSYIYVMSSWEQSLVQ
jgi:hypothetical protein